MQTFNILFYYLDNPHIAIVSFNPFVQSYTVYFTDVELVLAFGSKAELSRDGVLVSAKTRSAKDINKLRESIQEQINKVSLVA